MFRRLESEDITNFKETLLTKQRKDHFVGIWVNRNAKRKRPNDVLVSWKVFLDNLEKEHGHRKATLIMHTEPTDNEGPNLFKTSEMLGIQNNVYFSRDRLDFEKMNVLYNVSDFCLNISYAEGFGLSTLEAMMTGTPIIATKTGGLTRQVVDHRDGSENGVALDIDTKSLVGSQTVPYIYEDYVDPSNVAKGIMKLYNKTDEQRVALSQKVWDYAHTEFAMQKTVDLWDETLRNIHKTWRDDRQNWTLKTY
jgi:glycosyltransferase involved in cell wall biosynthesis